MKTKKDYLEKFDIKFLLGMPYGVNEAVKMLQGKVSQVIDEIVDSVPSICECHNDMSKYLKQWKKEIKK